MFEWKERYALGIREIDAQHRELVAMINRLFAAMQSGAGKDLLDETLAGLVAYARRHFLAEEMLMNNYDFPELEAHQEEHRKFAEEINSFLESYRTGNTGITIQLVTFLRNWLEDHICLKDHLYGDFLKQKGVH